MKNKHYFISLISASLLFQTGASAAPLVSIGDSTDIFFNGSSSLRSSSNIFRSDANEVDDFIWTLSPGFEVNVGRGASNADLSVITRYDIVRYVDKDDLDTELFHIKVQGTYETSRLDLSGSVSFDEEKSNSGDVQFDDDLIESDNFAANLNGEYRFSPKFSFGAGVNYSDKDYTGEFDAQLADRETTSLPLDLFYELTPKVDLSFGYTYTEKDVEATLSQQSYTQDSNFFNLGARGLLLPKLNGSFKVGYRDRSDSRAGVDDSGMLGLESNFSWAATSKLTVRLGLSRDFGVGGQGESTENFSMDLSGSYAINNYLAASANFDYTLRDYSDSGREDNQYVSGLRLSYTPDEFWRFSTGYSYTENDSTSSGVDYVDHAIDFTVALRY